MGDGPRRAKAGCASIRIAEGRPKAKVPGRYLCESGSELALPRRGVSVAEAAQGECACGFGGSTVLVERDVGVCGWQTDTSVWAEGVRFASGTHLSGLSVRK
jgi:hypothetical protein